MFADAGDWLRDKVRKEKGPVDSERSVDGEHQPDAAAQPADPFAAYRQRPRRSYWTMGLQAVETGDVLSTENHARVFELLPEDGVTFHTADAQARLVLLAAIPEEQLPLFAERDWEVGCRFDGGDRLEFLLIVGSEEPLECPFEFNLADPQDLQEAIQLTERQSVGIFGVTHMEEGLMLTLKGEVGLPQAFRDELRTALLALLDQRA